jgi:hypothetical protein
MTAVMSSFLNLSIVYGKRGEFKRTRKLLVEAVELGEEISVRFMTAASLTVLGDARVADQDPDAAERAYRVALEEATRGTTRGMFARRVGTDATQAKRPLNLICAMPLLTSTEATCRSDWYSAS